jgi:hypothetical protein
MSSLSILLRKLPLLCAAGAAGFVLGRVDARAQKPSDYELFPPRYAASAASEYARWYPTVRLLDPKDRGDVSPLPTAWHDCTSEGPSWDLVEPASPISKLYSGLAVLLPDDRVFLPCMGPAPSNEPCPPSPAAAR